MKEENGTRHEQQVRRLDLLQRNFETDIANYELETTEDIYDEDQDVIVRDLVFTRGMGRHEVLVNKEKVVLTATEFKLLSTLASRRGRVQDREQLLRDVWGYESYIDTRTVDTHMRRLRDKLGAAAGYLETVRGMGYRFCEGDL